MCCSAGVTLRLLSAYVTSQTAVASCAPRLAAAVVSTPVAGCVNGLWPS